MLYTDVTFIIVRVPGAMDFLGVNHYMTKIVSSGNQDARRFGFYRDQGVSFETDYSYPR